MNIGYSSRLKYDDDVYDDDVIQSTGPGKYKTSVDQTYNKYRCLSTLGPRTGRMGHGVSTAISQDRAAMSQDLVDIESILSNRNVRTSKGKKGHVNDIDVTKIRLHDASSCGPILNSEHTRLSHPSVNYREVAMSRFYNLPRDPQATIFWDFATNTSLEAKDNYSPSENVPFDMTAALPREDRTKKGSCAPKCSTDSRCPR